MTFNQGTFIHPLADVKSRNIGRNTKIWQFCVVMDGAEIGENCNICANCFIEENAKVGNECTIKNSVQLWNGITIEDNVFIGPNVVFTNDMKPLKEREKYEPQTTIIEKNVSIGANSTILPGIIIKKNSFISAASLVTKNISPYSLSYGSPAKHQQWISKFGEKIVFSKYKNNQFHCNKTGEIYEMKDNKIKIINTK